MAMKVTDERQAARDQKAELDIIALDLAAQRCELALKAAQHYKEQMELGAEMEMIGKRELDVHARRKQLAGILLAQPYDPAVV